MTSNSANADLVDPRGPVFISYRQSDGNELAENLAWGLRAAGIPVWHDQTDLPPGDTENRLAEALSSGISGAVLLVTPEVTNSTVIREVELPRLLELEKNPVFTFAVGSTVEHPYDAGSLHYSAPDQLLGQEQGTLQGLHQARIANIGESAALANAMCRRRMEALRRDIERASGLLRLDVQTRVPPYAMATEGDLVLRLRPPIDGERRPHVGGLHDLHRFLGHLPQLVAIAGASAVQVWGGAHLSVACAIGAALPTTLLGKVDVIDNQGEAWALTGQAPTPTAERQCENVKPPTCISKSGPVLVYVDLLPQRSDAAFEAFSQFRSDFAGIAHLRHRQEGLLVPEQAAAIVGELSSDIRSLANAHNTTDVHLLLRCPYPIALLLGRTLNTLTAHLYEWEDSPTDCPGSNPRYIPSVILRPGAGGSPIYSVTAPPLVGLT
ncbi:MAG: toll/interleukin-1 receptor domain-containing protein [Acidimicrobiia bacterium]|nr:toll/interleukin-1 receptor domain-containing protein [Acidimicrobiia bacterium]MYG73320.1 toll/interleukin-1 receptor domain-containing protein [Acidimicrobiia bacterium]